MRRAEHGKAINDPAIQPFAQDHARLDGFAYADIVCDQQPSNRLLERHHERNKLICARLYPEMGRASKWPSPAAKRQPQSIRQQLGAVLRV